MVCKSLRRRIATIVLGSTELAATLDLGVHGKEFALHTLERDAGCGMVNMSDLEREADATVRTN